MMRFASLASGSKGNCLVAEAGGSRVLLDCGLSPRETGRRLERLGLAPGELSAVLVTHEHDDHCGGAFAFAAAHGLALYLTRGTLRALEESGKTVPQVEARVIDAREPVQYVLSDGARRLGVLTDLGASTRHVERTLSGCDALVLECNHDAEMLWSGGYPKWLKQRIGGAFGHLANAQAETLLASLDRSRLKHVVGAHLSEQNNRPALARAALARALGCEESWVAIATQETGFGWRALG
jgi:phosphoribosyl 1,2-cyclic phosphodiesterase